MLNKIIVMGRITKDPELRRTQSGTPVTSITLAVDRDYQQGGEKQTDFIDVVAWRSTAEFIDKYLSKGRAVVVEGSLQSRKWTDKEGNKRISWEVQADRLYFADSRREDSSNTADESKATPGPAMHEEEDDGEIPF